MALKRAMDAIVAALLLLVLLPLLLVIAVSVKLTSPGPLFYVQERVGWLGRPLRMHKFRTMVTGADRAGAEISRDDPRITPAGRWLRRFSLDELPQLGHVLAGQMSLVGPRPAPPLVADHFTPAEQRRWIMRPGLTGWAQVCGRNRLRWSERVACDLWYVDNWSMWLDVQILWRTVFVIWRGTGLYGDDGWNRGYS